MTTRKTPQKKKVDKGQPLTPKKSSDAAKMPSSPPSFSKTPEKKRQDAEQISKYPFLERWFSCLFL